MHSPLDSIPHTFRRMHAPVHRRTCYPAHMHAHTFPLPVDSSANLLLLFMSISSCCYFYVFSSVCIEFTHCTSCNQPRRTRQEKKRKINDVEIHTHAYVATRLLLRYDYSYAVTLKTKIFAFFGDYNHARV